MIKIHCISQEYWYAKKQKCECSGDLDLVLQSLEYREGIPVDVHNTKCKKCGASKEFVFDISSFFNPLRSFKDLAEVEAVLKKVYHEHEVSMKMAAPMEAALMYVTQLKDHGDRIALQYLAEAILHALEDVSKGSA